MERSESLYPVIDGIDATLIDLATEEIGEDALVKIASGLADETFAARQALPASRQLLQTVFTLRARRIFAIREAGRLGGCEPPEPERA